MNTSSLQQFLQGDGAWIITAVAILLAIKAWKNSSWLQPFFRYRILGDYRVHDQRTTDSLCHWLVPTPHRY